MSPYREPAPAPPPTDDGFVEPFLCAQVEARRFERQCLWFVVANGVLALANVANLYLTARAAGIVP